MGIGLAGPISNTMPRRRNWWGAEKRRGGCRQSLVKWFGQKTLRQDRKSHEMPPRPLGIGKVPPQVRMRSCGRSGP